MHEDSEERLAAIALSLVPGVGPGRVRALLGRFGSAVGALAAPVSALAAVSGIGQQTANAIRNSDGMRLARDQVRQADLVGAEMVMSSDEAYPALLLEIYDPPLFLWLKGRADAMVAPSIAIVGTRRASSCGRRIAFDLAEQVAMRGVTVVSGLAYGIDAAAHAGALHAGGRSVAILGTGVDRVYPSAHRSLAKRLAEKGALVSEFALGTKPDAQNFPRRNRIVSGVALGVIVVEAFETGGALITAHLANEQNREVFAVPSAVDNPAGKGTNGLIKMGRAKLIQDVDDVFDELGHVLTLPTVSTRGAAVSDLSDEAQRLLLFVGPELAHIDLICARAGVDTSTALSVLLELEFKGAVRQMGGHHFYRIVV